MSVSAAVVAGGLFFGGMAVSRAMARPDKAPTPQRAEPTPRSTADVESGERQRASVFRRLSKLRRATLVSDRGAAEPQILNTKLGGV